MLLLLALIATLLKPDLVIGSDQNFTDFNVNASQNLTLANQNNTTDVCHAHEYWITEPMEIPQLEMLKCSVELKLLVADNVGLRTITNTSLVDLPRSVENFTVVRNNIPEIGEFTFSNLTLKHLNLSSNSIEIVAPRAFDNMTALESVIMDDNKISIFNFTFQNCPKVKLISLKQNRIVKLEEGTLRQIKKNVLSVLLSYNQIKEVHKAALDVSQFHVVHLDHNQLNNAVLLIKLVKAELVDLSMNNISCLPKEFMENGLSKIRTLNLTGNPLECSCLQDLRKKMRKNIEFQKMSPLVQNINIILPKNGTKPCKQ